MREGLPGPGRGGTRTNRNPVSQTARDQRKTQSRASVRGSRGAVSPQDRAGLLARRRRGRRVAPRRARRACGGRWKDLPGKTREGHGRESAALPFAIFCFVYFFQMRAARCPLRRGAPVAGPHRGRDGRRGSHGGEVAGPNVDGDALVRQLPPRPVQHQQRLALPRFAAGNCSSAIRLSSPEPSLQNRVKISKQAPPMTNCFGCE